MGSALLADNPRGYSNRSGATGRGKDQENFGVYRQGFRQLRGNALLTYVDATSVNKSWSGFVYPNQEPEGCRKPRCSIAIIVNAILFAILHSDLPLQIPFSIDILRQPILSGEV